MKKILALMAGVALLFSSTFFTSCSNDDDDDDDNNSSSVSTTDGSIVGYVLDNKGEPVQGATVSLGSKQAKTNSGGEFEIKNVAANDSALIKAKTSDVIPAGSTGNTAYSLTVSKAGYLSATVSGIYVTKQELESGASAAYKAALDALRNDYATILNGYDLALATGATSTSNTTTGTAGGSAIYTNTASTSTDAESVMKVIAEAISNLKNLYGDTEYYTEYYSIFGHATLIPCDASFTGSIKLNLSQKGASIYDGESYMATSKPTVRAIYKNYTFETTANSDGTFKFDKCLPSSVPLKFYIDAFTETVNETPHYFSSAESVAVLDNEGGEFDLANDTITLGSGASNEKTVVIMLYAQKDKVWVTDTNVITNSTANLLSVDTPLTFTFSQKLTRVDAVSSNITDINDGNFKAVIDSEDATKVTITPNDGAWTTTQSPASITLKVETTEGSTQILKDTFTIYFDTDIWVAVETESHDDDDGRIALDAPVVLTFSKAMTTNVVLSMTNVKNAYTKTWSDDKKSLTLKPATYWDLTANPVTISVTSGKAADDSDIFKYWKSNSDNGTNFTGLRIYFDNINDVALADTSTSETESFTISFSKALKSFDVEGKKNIVSIVVDGTTSAIDDYEASIDSDKKVVTITARDVVFLKAGKYVVTLKDIEAVDGSKVLRKAGDKNASTPVKGTTTTYEFTTDFEFNGLELKPVGIEVLPSLPATAVASRAIVSVTPASVLKITFSKPIFKSDINVAVGSGSAITTKNYIDSDDAKIVYIPLKDVTTVDDKIGLSNFASVQATDGGSPTFTSGNDYTTNELKEFFKGTEYYIYAALKLSGSSLIKENGGISGKSTYTVADPVEAKSAVTFTFESLPEGASAIYDLYVEDKDKAGSMAKVEDSASATISKNVVTVQSDKLVSVPAVADTKGITTYYLSLVVKNEDGDELFSTKNDFDVFKGSTDNFGSEFSKIVDGGVTDKTVTSNTNLGFNTIKVQVAPLSLVGSSLIDEKGDVSGTKTYSVAKSVEAKSAVTFTFKSLPEGASASYDLYVADKDNAGSIVKADSASATISENIVTVQSDKLVSVPAVANIKTGITTYYLSLVVKNDDGELFSTKNDFAVFKGSTDNFGSEFSKIVDGGVTDTTVTSDTNLGVNTIKIEVAPLSLVGSSLLTKDVFMGEATGNYTVADPIEPGSPVTFTFSSEIPAGATVSYAVYDTATAENLLFDKTTKLTAATDTVTIADENMVAETSFKDYYVTLIIKNGDDVLFSTANSYFGNASEYEQEIVNQHNYGEAKNYAGKPSTSLVDTKNGKIVIEVVKTAVVTAADDKESVTTTLDDFQKSYKSNIVLQFTHNVSGYNAVAYNSSSKVKSAPNSTIDTLKAPATTAGAADTYAEWTEKYAEFIYKTKVTVNDKVITIKPENFYGTEETIQIAIFNADGDCIIDNAQTVKNSSGKDLVSFKTAKETDLALVDELLDNSKAGELTLVTEETKIGNGTDIVLSVPVKLTSDSKDIATYKFYIKNAEDSAYSPINMGVNAYNKALTAELSVTDYRLHNEDTAYFKTILDDDAFGYNGSISLAVIEEVDGVRSVYEVTGIKDKVAPELTLSIADKTADKTLTLEKVSADAKKKDATLSDIDYTLSNTDAPPAERLSLAVQKDFVLTVSTGTKEWLSDVSAEITTPHTDYDKKTTSKATFTVEWNNPSEAKLKVSETLWFIGDEFTITATDASGNTSTYKVRIIN